MSRASALLLLVASLAAQQGDPVAFHQARAASRPGDGDALRLLAGALVARAEQDADGADYERAAEALDRADRLDPWFTPNVLLRARLLLSRHRFLAARGLAEEGLRRWAGETGFLDIAGDAALEMGDYDGAIAHYRRLHQQKPQMSSWARLAHWHELRQDWEKAHELMSKALEEAHTAPPESRAWCRAILGEIELKRGNPDAARRHYEAGLRESPSHPLVLEHLAELEQQQGPLPAAIKAYREILARRMNPVIALRLADLLDGAGSKQEADQMRRAANAFLERAVGSGNEGFLRPLAEQRLSQGRFEEAAQMQVRDVLLRPTADACEVLGRIRTEAQKAGVSLKETGSGICGAAQPLPLKKLKPR